MDEDDEDDHDIDGTTSSSRKKRASIVSSEGGLRINGTSDKDNNKTCSSSECSSVPVKPILMCFICKLSFGYTKSFIAHAMGDHNLILIDQEKDVLNQRNVSAIIQPVGKNKDPTISFLEPTTTNRGAPAASAAGVNNIIQSVPIQSRALHPSSQQQSSCSATTTSQSLLFRSNSTNHSDDNIKSSPINSPDHLLSSPPTPRMSNSGGGGGGMDLTRKSPASGRSSASPAPSSTPNSASILNNNLSPSGSQMSMGNAVGGPPNFITGTTIGVCPEHLNGRPSGADCSKCEMILNSSRMGALGNLHTRNSCKTLKCPK